MEPMNWIVGEMRIASFAYSVENEMQISSPFNFQQICHVDFNSTTGLVGLPPEWDAKILSSDISKKDVMENSAALIDVIDFLDKKEKQETFKAATQAKAESAPNDFSNSETSGKVRHA